LALSAALLCAAAAGCSSGSSSKAGSSPSTATSSSAPVSVSVATVGSLGGVLVDSNGYTLYLFQPDKQGAPTCTGTCAQSWPPLQAGSATPTAGAGAQAAMVGTVASGSGHQVTYNRWPLYTFTGDSGPGQATGEGLTAFGGSWWAVGADGVAVHPSGSSSTSTTAKSGYGH
jgi:predicted lipoprotein with Yx(FWY)xxD motif